MKLVLNKKLDIRNSAKIKRIYKWKVVAFFKYNFSVSGANPTTLSYNASVVKIYNSNNSMARFYNIFSDIKTLLRTTYNAGVVAVNSQVVGLASAFIEEDN
jgi:hypothetical protein